MRRKSTDLFLLLLIVIVAVGLVLAGLNRGALGLVFGLPLALLIPGYALTAAFLPASAQEQPNLSLYSIGISLAVTIVDGLLLNLTPVGLQPGSWAVTLGGLSFFAILAALARRWRERREACPVTHITHRLRSGEVLALAAAVLLLVGAYMVTRTATLREYTPGFSQLWLLPAGPTDQKSVLVGVRNMENAPTDYRVELNVGSTLIAQWKHLSLQSGEEWQQVVSLSNQQIPAGNHVELLLYRLDEPGQIYRHATLTLP